MDTASANRTIIDVVMQGNRELCHSAVIAWLLDPNAEHGLGRRFLDNLVAKLPPDSTARRILSLGVTTVEREATSGCHRYDIRLGCGTDSVVIENKVKSIGCCLQLEGYQENEVVVGLGFSQASFDNTSHDKFPILTYRDVLDALEESGPAKGDWRVLAEHYAVFLRRELRLLDAVLDCYAHGKLDHDTEIIKATDACGENDKRFLLLVFLEEFQEVPLRPTQLGKYFLGVR